VFEHLLVPLDGSALAESVLPTAAGLAAACGARVTLVHVIERDAPREVHGQRHLGDPGEATQYLARVAAKSFPAAVAVEWHVHLEPVGHVAKAIAEHTEELATDLTVMCTHGASGVRDFLFGSIAQQIADTVAGALLILRPRPGEPAPGFQCRRLLVPLDGDPAHEAGLAVAADLGRACDAGVHLLRVVPTFSTLSGPRALQGRLLPGTTSRLLELDAEHARAYLERHRAALAARGVAASAEVGRGAPAELIAEAARHPAVDLVVLTTHGRRGMAAFWEGSVGARLCRGCATPLLTVPAGP